ncbi:MAG: phospholipase D-like domain-containing protein [Verrucomicrobiales bacterium]
MEGLLNSRFTTGNAVDILLNGDEIFPAMLEAIKQARRSIRFVTYVYWQGDIAETFAEAIAERARAGVSCHVLLDAYGSLRMRSRLIRTMREAGAKVCRYNPFSMTRIPEYQHRTHRKILVCDGEVGFLGGVGIANEWTGHAQDPDHWHDFHFRVRGPAVEKLAEAFDDNWHSSWTRAKGGGPPEPIVVDRKPDPPASEPPSVENSGSVGDLDVLVFHSSPEQGRSEAFRAYREMLVSAHTSVRVVTAYLIPDDGMLKLLRSAVERGVEVEVIAPGKHCDSWLASKNSQAKWACLLEMGVRIFEYRQTMCHAKATIVDDRIVTVGSINFDMLSLHLNDEANIVVSSERFAKEMRAHFERDKSVSSEVTLAEWRERSRWQRLFESTASLFPLPWWGSSCNY